jgi:hypothetical protein
MIASRPATPICLPPAPLNGGPLDTAPAKVGAWRWQPKPDDRRVIIHTESRTIWNQYGQLSVAQDSMKFEHALDQLEKVAFAAPWLDCGLMEYRHDMMRGTIIVFDVVNDDPFEERRTLLDLMFEPMPWATEVVGSPLANDRVYLIPQFGDLVELDVEQDRHAEDAGRNLYAALQRQNDQLGRKFYEGVVVKRIGSFYPQRCQRPKQPTADWIKHRFDQ